MRGSINIVNSDLKDLLDNRVALYNNLSFIEEDPISIPHLFSSKENIEISGFLTAIISWGQRKQIIKSARHLMSLMDDDPYAFLLDSDKADLLRFRHFYYRTFNNTDCIFFLNRLKETYKSGKNLQQLFENQYAEAGNIKDSITGFRQQFFGKANPERSGKHLSDPAKGSSAKRINMFLRWMVRKDENGVDFGLWNGIPRSELRIPLDIHIGYVARKLGLLQRSNDDWKSVEELTTVLRQFDPADPVKYDFALFGLGINEKF